MTGDIRRVGVAGLGAMGSGVAARLLEHGYEVAVYNRTAIRAEPLAAAGARVAATPADLGNSVDLVLLCLADAAAVDSVVFGEAGLAPVLPYGALLADLSTIPPDFARRLAARLALCGVRALDACVLGNARHARDGELRIMVGGAEEDLAAVRPVLEAIGKEITHLGGHGAGATMKLALNLVMGIQMQALAEAVVFGERAGLPRETVLDLVAASGFSSPVMKFKAGVMRRRAFGRADFRLSLMRKDLTLVLADCQRLGVPMPACEAAYGALTAAVNQGLGDQDCAAILTYMERLSGLSH
jgi:3-hydroxyisobutyrate dehydrogenase